MIFLALPFLIKSNEIFTIHLDEPHHNENIRIYYRYEDDTLSVDYNTFIKRRLKEFFMFLVFALLALLIIFGCNEIENKVTVLMCLIFGFLMPILVLSALYCCIKK